MRIERNRTKKLTIAFHFEAGGQTGWECESCRKNGLEERRGCALGGHAAAPAPVWVRGGVEARRCPVSLMTPETARWLEMYRAQQRLGAWQPAELPWRDLLALLHLESEERCAAQRSQRRERHGQEQ